LEEIRNGIGKADKNTNWTTSMTIRDHQSLPEATQQLQSLL